MSKFTEADSSPGGSENLTAFLLGERQVSIGEVIWAAEFRGDTKVPRTEFLRKVACSNHASAQDLEPDDDALQAVADQFRYERDLITTEETEQWLEARGLSFDDFLNHVSRTYWHQSLGEDVSVPDLNDPSAAEAEGFPQLTIDLLLTGAFKRMARDLAWRLAAQRVCEAAQPGALRERIESEREHLNARTGFAGDDVSSWLESMGATAAWLEETLAAEAAYAQKCAEMLTEEQLTRELRSQRLGLMRFELEGLEFDTMEAAREAVFCVRQDGMTMEEVANESRYPYQHHDFIQEDLPAEWQVPLVSTPEGGLLGPLVDGDLIRLFKVVRKIEPTTTDELIRPRLEQRVLEAGFGRLCAEQGYKNILG